MTPRTFEQDANLVKLTKTKDDETNEMDIIVFHCIYATGVYGS